MPKPGTSGSLGSDAGSQELQPVLDRTTSLPNIGDATSAAPPAGPSRRPTTQEEERRGGGTGAVAAAGPPTTSSPARVAPTPSTSRQHEVPVRPTAFRSVPMQAPGPAAKLRRAPRARARVASARLPTATTVRSTAPAAHAAAPARTYAQTTRYAAPYAQPVLSAHTYPPYAQPVLSAHTYPPYARPRVYPESTVAPPLRFAFPPAPSWAAFAMTPTHQTGPAPHTAASGPHRSLVGPAMAEREWPPLKWLQVPTLPAPPRASALDSPAMLPAYSSLVGSSMSLASADLAVSGREDVSLDTTLRSGRRPTEGGADLRNAPPPQTPSPLGFGFEFQLETRLQRRRRRSDQTTAEEEEAKRYCLEPPRPQSVRASRGRDTSASPTFADAARRTPPRSPSPEPDTSGG